MQLAREQIYKRQEVLPLFAERLRSPLRVPDLQEVKLGTLVAERGKKSRQLRFVVGKAGKLFFYKMGQVVDIAADLRHRQAAVKNIAENNGRFFHKDCFPCRRAGYGKHQGGLGYQVKTGYQRVNDADVGNFFELLVKRARTAPDHFGMVFDVKFKMHGERTGGLLNQPELVYVESGQKHRRHFWLNMKSKKSEIFAKSGFIVQIMGADEYPILAFYFINHLMPGLDDIIIIAMRICKIGIKGKPKPAQGTDEFSRI